MIPVYWACKDIGNVGDVLSKYIAEKITGKKAQHTPKDKPHYMITGSILQEATRHSIVAGAGFGDETQRFDPQARVLFVRGPLTKHWVKHNMGLEVSYLFDPAAVMPLLYNPRIEKDCDLGVVPHYVDLAHVNVNNGIKVISPLQPVEKFIDALLSCQAIISSSLHGIILAHAYGIPALWVEFSSGVAGNGFKFYDYLMSADVQVYQPMNLRGATITADIIKHVPEETGSATYHGPVLKGVLKGTLL